MGTAQEEFCSGIRTFKKALAGAMKTADSKVARAMEKSLRAHIASPAQRAKMVTPPMKLTPNPLLEAWKDHNTVTWPYNTITGCSSTSSDAWAYNKIVAKPPIWESDQDQRSEARRWLDERVEEVRVLAWE